MKQPRYVGETDEGWREFIDHLRSKTPLKALNFIEARAVFREVTSLGFRIQFPDRHPSGLATTKSPLTTVKPLHSRPPDS